MASHDFGFEGGEILRKIGAAWFVSYSFYERADRTHKNWERVATSQNRISHFKQSTEKHSIWLQRVLDMNPANLNKNTIGLDASEIKKMAQELLGKPAKKEG